MTTAQYTNGLVKHYLENRQSIHGSLNLDDNAIAFFQRQLEKDLGKVFESLKPTLTVEQDIVTQAGLPYGTKSVFYTEVDTRGQASIIAGGSDDIKQVSMLGQEVSYKRARMAIGYSYSQEELDTMFENTLYRKPLNVNEYKLKGCIYALDDLSEKLGYYGDTNHGITGLLTDPALTVVNDTFKPYLTTQTAEALYLWFVQSYNYIVTETRQRFSPNTCLIPLKLMIRLQSVRSLSANNETAWDMVSNLMSQMGVQLVNREALRQSELELNGVTNVGDNKEIMVFYHKSPDTTFRMINDIRTQPFERRNLNFSTIMYYDVTSTIIPYKEVVSIIKYPIATT
jgi:hypothetical protein